MNEKKNSKNPIITFNWMKDAYEYWLDSSQRSILFMDILRKRGNNYFETIKKGEIPSSIEKVDDKILDEILVCEKCDKNFRITKAELDFYKRMNLPLPHKDFECRHQERIAKRNPHKLWHRSCMCELSSHEHSGRCPNEFETPYSPDRSEIVYCESCYQQEVA